VLTRAKAGAKARVAGHIIDQSGSSFYLKLLPDSTVEKCRDLKFEITDSSHVSLILRVVNNLEPSNVKAVTIDVSCSFYDCRQFQL
jgi:hypothetical protein